MASSIINTYMVQIIKIPMEVSGSNYFKDIILGGSDRLVIAKSKPAIKMFGHYRRRQKEEFIDRVT